MELLDDLFILILSKNQNPTTLEIQAFLKEKGQMISEKLLLYHLKRLIDLNLIVRKRKRYFLNAAPNSASVDFTATFNHWVSQQVSRTVQELDAASTHLAESYAKMKS